MAEGYPLDAESAGKALQRATDELFSASLFGAFTGDNEHFLNDLGLAISHGVADGDSSVECIRIANWNTKDLVTFERSFDATAISDGVEDVTLRITHQDMMGDSIQAPFFVNGNPVIVPAMMFALTASNLIAPYVQVPQGESSVMLTPDPEDCYLNNQVVLAHLLQITQLPIFLELYHESDLDLADVISAGAS